MPNNLNAALEPDFEGDLDQMLVALKELDENMNLQPDQLRVFLGNFIKTIEKKERGELKIVFPKVFMIQKTDVGGFAITDVLRNMIVSLDHYEPPILRAGETEGVEAMPEEPKQNDLPAWLQGHENLIWKGASKNPLWKVEPRTYDDQITISYRRGNTELRPGKSKFEQTRELKDIKHVFDREEWQIIEPVIGEYLKFKDAHDKNPAGVSKEVKREILNIILEEQAWRKGKSEETPTLLRAKLAESLKKIAKAKRWGKDKNMEEKLTELTQATAEILSQLMVLNSTRSGGSELIPKIDKSIKEIPTFVEALDKLVICLEYQTGEKEGRPAKGFTLLLGEPGVGKNELIKYMAGMSGRPFFWFPCGRGMEAQDLVHHYEFDSKEGTKRFFTALAEGLQTPGALIMIDEANALKPQVQAILHGLGDSNRTLKYDGIEIPVAEGVLIVIAGNPATQGSAGNFGEPILSRTRGQAMIMEYPALTRSDLLKRQEYLSEEKILEMEQKDNTLKEYLCDEALALYPTFNEFSGLNDLEFEYVWQRILNEHQVPIEDDKFADLDKKKLEAYIAANEKQARDLLVDLRDILRIADLWRKRFEKRELVLGLSMRDTLALVQAYKKLRDVRKAYLRIFDDFRKNPIDGLDVMFVQIGEIVDHVLKGDVTPDA
jgi:hypothetical protein